MLYGEKVYLGEMTMDDLIGYVSYGEIQKYSIIHSDNPLSELLQEHTGHYEQYRKAIAPYLCPDTEELDPTFRFTNMFTPEQMLTCLRMLYDEPERYPDVLEYMKQAEPENYFAYSEQRYPIAHKYGYFAEDGYLTLNDAGIIYTDDPFILVVMSECMAGNIRALSEYCSLMCDYTMYQKALREKEAENPSGQVPDDNPPQAEGAVTVSPTPETNIPSVNHPSDVPGTDLTEEVSAPNLLPTYILAAFIAVCVIAAIALLIFGKKRGHRLVAGALILASCVIILIVLDLKRDKVETDVSPTPSVTETATTTLNPESTVDPELMPPKATPSPEGDLFLTVSHITFSLVGESENIYWGSIPAENVIWTSADESIVTVENGLLTAVGVGETTVTAQFGEKSLRCTAACLAETEEELYALPEDTLRSPKRIPLVPENPPVEFFADAALMGDSITYILMQNEARLNILQQPAFIVRGGTSLLGIENRSYNFSYGGVIMDVEETVAVCGRNKLFIMLGQNDLGYRSIQDTLASYGVIVSRIRERNPEVDIYIQTVVHEWAGTHDDNSRNEKIDAFTPLLRNFAEENGCHFVDIQRYIVDHTGRMAKQYSLGDQIHLNEAGCIEWMHALLAYVYAENIGGKEL